MGFLDLLFPSLRKPLEVDGKPETPNGTTPGGRFGPGPVTPNGSLASNATEITYVPNLVAGTIPATPRVGDAPAGIWGAAFNYQVMPLVYWPVSGGNLGNGSPTVERLRVNPRVQYFIDPVRLDSRVRKDVPR